MGAWIEIFKAAEIVAPAFVAPLVGAWIEMLRVSGKDLEIMSLPLWERGLKFLTASVPDRK